MSGLPGRLGGLLGLLQGRGGAGIDLRSLSVELTHLLRFFSKLGRALFCQICERLLDFLRSFRQGAAGLVLRRLGSGSLALRQRLFGSRGLVGRLLHCRGGIFAGLAGGGLRLIQALPGLVGPLGGTSLRN